MESTLTVVTPAAATALLDLAAVKAELGITTSAEDAYLNSVIARVSSQICTYLRIAAAENGGATLAIETLQETFRIGRAVGALMLSRYPVGAVSGITVDDVAVEPADYAVNRAAGLVYRLSSDDRVHWKACSKVVVSYTGGYTLSGASRNLPYDIESAAMALLRSERSAKNRDPLAKEIDIPDVMRTAYWVGGVSANGSGMAADIEARLAPYRRSSL